MKEPNPADANRCIDLRLRSKQGKPLTDEEMDFVATMYANYREWYYATERRVFNEAAPFGAKLLD